MNIRNVSFSKIPSTFCYQLRLWKFSVCGFTSDKCYEMAPTCVEAYEVQRNCGIKAKKKQSIAMRSWGGEALPTRKIRLGRLG